MPSNLAAGAGTSMERKSFIIRAQPVLSTAKQFPGGTMADRLEDFQKFRADLNEEILGCGHLGMKRFFALDHQAYEPGPLGTKTKELLGLVASAVLRCDDCITYHLVRCGEEGWKRDEVIDALNVALIVGGSIAIPHVRRAFARMREIKGLKP
jgi:AhpD family alkylhydroperoxidase